MKKIIVLVAALLVTLCSPAAAAADGFHVSGGRLYEGTARSS
jgi:hypothetical protein